MDSSLLLSPSVPKRPCSSFVYPPVPVPAPAPAPAPAVPALSLSQSEQMDHLLEAFLGFSDSSSAAFLDFSLERIIESRASDSDQNSLIESALRLGSLLLESGKRLQRKRFTHHNSISWLLPPDLTIKVFSMLDTQSLCYAAATCSMFNKCAMDPLCYTNIDLTTIVPKINNMVVYTMIQRAGRNLQSLKLGVLPAPNTPNPNCSMVYTIRNSDAGVSWNERRSRQGKELYVLTRSCLSSLSTDGGSFGALLRRLHLYNIDRMGNTGLSTALSSCPSLLDLKVVGLPVELIQILESVSTNCHLMERLFVESKSGRDDSLKLSTCVDLVNGCPHLILLSLRGFRLQDSKAQTLLKGFRKLRVADFSTSYSITGSFLSFKSSGKNGHPLEVLLLRDCMHLKESEVARFVTAVLAGDFKSLRYLDISNRDGLASDGDWYKRSFSTGNIPVKQLSEERPQIRLVAEFPPDGSFAEMENDLNGETSSLSQMSSHSSDVSMSMSTSMSRSDSSYNSDQGSGNEDGHDGGGLGRYGLYDGSSDEVDYLPG